MKKLSMMMLGMLFVAGSAIAADPVVSHVEFNPKKNAYTVELAQGSPQTFDSAQLVIKLDANATAATLKKGSHLYYVIFPSFEEMVKISNDMKP
jgi:hypothetical protein